MNNWEHIEKEYDNEFKRLETIEESDVSQKVINYESLLVAILDDLHMVNIPRQMAINEASFINFAYIYFPVDSEAFAWAQKVVGLKYICNCKNEFIACYKRGDDPKNVIYITRAEAEYNPKYVQIVAMAIPFVKLPSGEIVYIFVAEHKSDMLGHTTMIGGHVQYKYDTPPKYLETIMLETARREALEEMGLENNSFIPKGKIMQYSPLLDIDEENGILGGQIYENPNDDIRSISKYHRGISYTFEIDPSALKYINMEEGKNIILWTDDVTFERHETPTDYYWETTIDGKDVSIRQTCHIDNPDPWLKKFMESVKHD